jgi:hypothetical protein
MQQMHAGHKFDLYRIKGCNLQHPEHKLLRLYKVSIRPECTCSFLRKSELAKTTLNYGTWLNKLSSTFRCSARY